MNISIDNSTTTTTLTLPTCTGSILALAWSPGGAHLAAATSRGYVCVWDITSSELLLQKQITRSRLLAVAWSHQGRTLLLGSEHGMLSTQHLATESLVTTSTFSQPITRISWSPNAITPRFFVVMGQILKVFTQGKSEPTTLRYHTPIQDACWNPDGTQVALLCRNGLVEVWDAPTRRVIWKRAYQDVQAGCITWEATGRRLVLGCQDGRVQFQSLSDASADEVMPFSRYPIQDVRWGERYLVVNSETEIAFWDSSTALSSLSRATPVQTLAFDPHGTILATAQQSSVALAAL